MGLYSFRDIYKLFYEKGGVSMKEKKKKNVFNKVFMTVLTALGICTGISKAREIRRNRKERMESDY